MVTLTLQKILLPKHIEQLKFHVHQYRRAIIPLEFKYDFKLDSLHKNGFIHHFIVLVGQQLYYKKNYITYQVAKNLCV